MILDNLPRVSVIQIHNYLGVDYVYDMKLTGLHLASYFDWIEFLYTAKFSPRNITFDDKVNIQNKFGNIPYQIYAKIYDSNTKLTKDKHEPIISNFEWEAVVRDFFNEE